MDIKIICDFREDFENLNIGDVFFNDHPTRNSVEEICNILNSNGHNCEIFGGVNQLIEAYNNKTDLSNSIFLNMSDGLTQPYSRLQVPMLCEMLNVNYSGSPIFSVALMNNKHYSKLAVDEIGISNPAGILINNFLKKSYSLNDIELPSYPLIVKPNTEGSSLGITATSVCNNIEQLKKALDNLANFSEIIIEEYIPGYEITNLILGNPGDYRFNEVVLTSVRDKIFLSHEVLGFEEKALKLRKQHTASNYIDDKLCEQIKNNSIQIFEHIGCRDIARIDYRVTENGDIYFLEINLVPRISSTTECSIICEANNIPFKNIILEYIDTISMRIFNHAK